MLTSRVLLVPSSPTLLIDERRGTLTDMLEALAVEGGRFEADAPEVVVVVTSRWIGTGLFEADHSRHLTSLIDLPGFGVEPRYDSDGEPELARSIVRRARRAGLPAAAARRGNDSGVTVPLHFLTGGQRLPVVPVSLSDLPADAHRKWGACLREVMEGWSARSAFVVSGALTFSEHDFNLNREIAEDRDLDLRAIDALRAGDWDQLFAARPKRNGRAHPDAGWKHLEVLRGFLGADLPGHLHAYEAVPGIGSALMEFEVTEPAPSATARPASDERPAGG